MLTSFSNLSVRLPPFPTDSHFIPTDFHFTPTTDFHFVPTCQWPDPRVGPAAAGHDRLVDQEVPERGAAADPGVAVVQEQLVDAVHKDVEVLHAEGGAACVRVLQQPPALGFSFFSGFSFF